MLNTLLFDRYSKYSKLFQMLLLSFCQPEKHDYRNWIFRCQTWFICRYVLIKFFFIRLTLMLMNLSVLIWIKILFRVCYSERRVTFSENLLTIRQEGIPISSKKYKHLQTWMPWILLQFHDFYKKLSHSETVINDM